MKFKALIPTMGTRGDIQPYIALAREMNNSGFQSIIASHPCWKELVEGYNLDFFPIGPDIDIELEAARIRGRAKHWIMGMLRTMKFMFKIIKKSSPEIMNLCREMDIVIASHSHIGAAEAEACGIPFVSVTLQPGAIPEKLKPAGKFENFLNKTISAFINPFMVGPYNGLRKELGLKAVKAFDELISKELNIIPISPAVYPEGKYWEEKNQMTGYWFVDGEEGYLPSLQLRNFLEDGEPPVIISLGAMSFESKAEQDKLEVLVNSINRTGMRAVIQGFNRSLQDYSLPGNIISIGSVPHNWLFQHAYCVIHHGGFGTTAAVLKAGVPAIVIPHVLDQFFWANRVLELGAGPEPVKNRELNEDALVARLEKMKTNYDLYLDKARDLSEKIKQEEGLKETVSLIKKVI